MAQGLLLGFERNNNTFSVLSTFNPEFNNPMQGRPPNSAKLARREASSSGVSLGDRTRFPLYSV